MAATSPQSSQGPLEQRVRDLQNEVLACRRTEEALRKSEETYRLLAESAAEMILLCDPEWRITYANPAGLAMGGYRRRELLGKRLHRFLEVKEAPQDADPDGETGAPFHNGEPWEAAFRHVEGHTVPIEVVSTPVAQGGATEGFLLTARDISNRRSMERELLRAKKLESIGVLAGGIAHDYNNLLTAIIGYITLVESLLDSNEEAASLLGRARHAAVMAKNLSKKLIVFSRGGKPMKRPGAISPLLENVLSFALAGSNIECELRVPNELWPVAYDEGQMSQAIHNIVTNAREAMPAGGTIRVKAENMHIPRRDGFPVDPGDWVRITLEDEGGGIIPEHLDKIFDPYFTTKEMGAQKGLGLGLAISHSIVRNHQGYLFAESEPERGTILHVYLPAADTPRTVSSSAASSVDEGETTRILIMDDEEIVRDITGKMLKRAGCEVTLCREGSTAVDLYSRRREEGNPYHVVLLDLTVRGGMGGKEAVRALLEVDPDLRAIVSSGYADDPVMTDFRAYGFSAAVTKPYSIYELREAIESALKDRL